MNWLQELSYYSACSRKRVQNMNLLYAVANSQGLMCYVPLIVVRARLQVNNGVYKSGFATTQAAYERAQSELWTWLDILEDKLSTQRFLTGSRYGLGPYMIFTTMAMAHPEIAQDLTMIWVMLTVQVHTGRLAAVPNTRTL